ncbi:MULTISPECIES: nucleotide disphospho-sugar-binding domain-containing protein [unclassified Streptomyces]|uniref:nucleotide disphospho-sugar-binding domain-containing protein n=1 Tax=unclassified Streptomyces TaxID=2593676 RepID=UPI00037288F4|nr:nucleotide disphospho-sugar-binding domain-containing protein [Streptomyces sp. HmicA12]
MLFTVSAWPGHYYPLVPLGWGLQAAGHEVRFACAPSQRDTLSGAGLTPAPVLAEIDMAFLARLQNVRKAAEGDWPYPGPPPHPVTGQPLTDPADFSFEREIVPRYVKPLKQSYAAAVELAEEWRPQLVVHEPLSMEGLLAARVTGVPSALHLWGPVGTVEDPGLGLVPQDFTGSFREYGVGELGPDLIDRAVDPCPAPLRGLLPDSTERLPMRYVPYNGPGAVPDWLLDAPDRPRVCVVWGNSPRRMVGADAFALPRIVRALDGLGVEVVLAAGRDDLAQLGEVPSYVRVLENFPLQQLLPSCVAVVHHGGAGAVMTAVAHGVPQLVIPHAMDQFTNADRVAASGAGLVVRGYEITEDGVRDALARLFDEPSFIATAAELQEQMSDLASPLEMAGTLEELAAAG